MSDAEGAAGPSLRRFGTPRLVLRAIEPGDEAFFCRLYTDALTMRYIGPPLSAAQAARGFRGALRAMRRDPPERWFLAIDVKPDCHAGAATVGLCSIQHIDPHRRNAEAGIIIRPEAWGQGYAKEGLAALVTQAFRTALVDEIWVRISAEHAVVERLVVSIGFSRTGRSMTGADGTRVDVWSAARGSWAYTTTT